MDAVVVVFHLNFIMRFSKNVNDIVTFLNFKRIINAILFMPFHFSFWDTIHILVCSTPVVGESEFIFIFVLLKGQCHEIFNHCFSFSLSFNHKKDVTLTAFLFVCRIITPFLFRSIAPL